jgi:hypothetical protein
VLFRSLETGDLWYCGTDGSDVDRGGKLKNPDDQFHQFYSSN